MCLRSSLRLQVRSAARSLTEEKKEKETVKEVTHEWELVNKQKPIWMRDNTRRFFVILHWWLFHRRQGRQR